MDLGGADPLQFGYDWRNLLLKPRAPSVSAAAKPRLTSDGFGWAGASRPAVRNAPILNVPINASCEMLTLPYSRIRALPFFCLSRSLRLRLVTQRHP